MKKKILFLWVLLSTTVCTFAYDFKSGDLYYEITSNRTVGVTFEAYYDLGIAPEERLTNYSGLTSVVIPESVTYGGNTYSVTSILGYYGDYGAYGAFSGCDELTSVTIPNSVTSIGEGAFRGCTGLTKTNYTGSIADWCRINFSGRASNPVYYSQNLFINDVLITDLVIPEGITTINVDSFCDDTCLTSITIPNSVTSIGYAAFSGCTGLTSVTIPNSVTSIGGSAFYNCSGLTSITIPNSVTSIGKEAFDGTSWYDNQPNGVVYINNALYCYKGYMPQGTSIVVKEGTICISASAFYNRRGLTTITIPNSVMGISSAAFSGCTNLTKTNYTGSIADWCRINFSDRYSNPVYYSQNLFINDVLVTDLVIPEGITTINDYSFCNDTCLTSITIPNSVTSIGNYAFEDCTGLTSVTIPNSVTSIGKEAFSSCTGLTSVTIGNSVTSIGDYAFEQCSGLREIVFKPITPPYPQGSYDSYEVFSGCNNVKNVYIPCGTKTAYTTLITDWDERIFTEMAPTISATTEDATKGTAHMDQQASCDNNKTAIISATPAEHYRFAQWNDGNTDNPRTIVATEDATYTAEFIAICNITVVYDIKQGYVSGDGTGTYDFGTRVRLVAEPNSGYEFSQWSDGTTFNPYIFAATEDLTLEALFIPTTAIEDIPAEDAEGVQKILHDGQMYILRNGKAYDIVGREVKF